MAASTRKLTTILASDVVGYSRLMATDKEATLATLRTCSAVISELVAKHGGRVFNTAGDAVLAEFGSAVEAVRCAISIQEDLAVRNSQLPDESQMWLPDRTRIDCLSPTHAIEVDLSEKWAEAFGQGAPLQPVDSGVAGYR